MHNSHIEFFEQQWKIYESKSKNVLPKVLYNYIYPQVLFCTQIIFNIFSGEEHQGIALYTFEVIINESCSEILDELLIKPFKGLAFEDYKMIVVTDAIKILHTLCHKNSLIGTKDFFIEGFCPDNISKKNYQYPKFYQQYFARIREITLKEIKDKIYHLKKQGAVTFNFRKSRQPLN